MIILTTFNFDEEGYIEFPEDKTRTVYPEIKKNIKAEQTLNNDIVIEDRGVSYFGSKIEITSIQKVSFEFFERMRRFLEKNGVFKITLDIGTYEVYAASLKIERGQIKLDASVKRLIE